ncbi:MAG TPA: hypothetical protein V6C85_18130 [Allocoleopsis sp.]
MKNDVSSVDRVKHKTVVKNLGKSSFIQLRKLNAIADWMPLLVLLSVETILKVTMLLESSFHAQYLV